MALSSGPWTNSCALRGPFSGQWISFIVSMPHRGRTLLANLLEAVEAVEGKGGDQVRRRAGRQAFRHPLAADRGGLEAPGAPAGVDEVVAHRRRAHHRAEV